MLEILYYPNGDSGPVRDYLDQLARLRPNAFARLAIDLEVLGAEGLRSAQLSVRSLGQKLWELRRLHDGIQYRIFMCAVKGHCWLLHVIEKKSAKTPRPDLELARRRLREVM